MHHPLLLPIRPVHQFLPHLRHYRLIHPHFRFHCWRQHRQPRHFHYHCFHYCLPLECHCCRALLDFHYYRALLDFHYYRHS